MTSDQQLAKYLQRVIRYRPHRIERERFHPLNESEQAWLEQARRNRKKNA